ncbi:MAG: (2Fe-2S) ferredoxin domain-containing protein [Sporichthyaceae bacterium]
MTVTVCRGCCCGNPAKRHPFGPGAPTPDEAWAELAAASAAAGHRMRASDCLGPCENADVVVVAGRGRKSLWLGEIRRPEQLARVAAWLRNGARPDEAPHELTFRPPKY